MCYNEHNTNYMYTTVYCSAVRAKCGVVPGRPDVPDPYQLPYPAVTEEAGPLWEPLLTSPQV